MKNVSTLFNIAGILGVICLVLFVLNIHINITIIDYIIFSLALISIALDIKGIQLYFTTKEN